MDSTTFLEVTINLRGLHFSLTITPQLAARVMKDVEREQRAAEEILRQEMAKKELLWARARRDLLLTRHPTNWAGCFLLQARSIVPKEAGASLRRVVGIAYIDYTKTSNLIEVNVCGLRPR